MNYRVSFSFLGGIIYARIARKNLNTSFLHVMVQGINKEYIFNKNTKVVVTILKVKEKFLPITQFLIENKTEKYNIVQRSEPKKKPLASKELFGIL